MPTKYGIAGTSTAISVPVAIVLKNQLSLVGDVEYTQGSGDNNHAAVGYLGLAYRF